MSTFLQRIGLLDQFLAAPVGIQAPTIIALTENWNSSGFYLTYPTNQDGDFLLLIHQIAGSGIPATMPGFTSIATASRGGDHAVNVQYKWADGEDTVGTFVGYAGMVSIRGVDRYTPIDAASIQNSPSGGSTNFPFSDLTTITEKALVCCFASSATDASSGTVDPWNTFTFAGLIDHEEVIDRVHPYGSGGGMSLNVGTMETAGATGTGSVEHYVSESYRFTFIFALKPIVTDDIPADVGGDFFQPYVSNFFCPAFTGKMDVSVYPNYTVTPKAMIVLGSEVVNVGSFAHGLGANFGVATLANQFAVSTKEEERIPSYLRENTIGHADRVVNVFDAQIDGGTTPASSASLDSFSIGAAHFDWSNADATLQRIQTAAFLGGNINVKAGKIALGATGVAVTETVGFKPNALIFFSPSRTATAGGLLDGTLLADSVMHWGFASWDDTTVRQCSFARWYDQDDPADIRAGATENGVFTLTDPTAGYAEVSNFTGTGFDLTTRVFNPTAATQEVCYLAIGNVNAWVGVMDTPIVTGNVSYTGPGFQPKFAMVSLTNFTAIEAESTLTGTPAHIGMAHGPDNEFCYTWSVEVATPGANTESRSREYLLDIVSEDTDFQMCQANLASWDPYGLTIDYTLLDVTQGWTTTPRKLLGLFIGEAPLADPHVASVVLDIDFNGAEGTSAAIDKSPSGHILTKSGSVVYRDATPPPWQDTYANFGDGLNNVGAYYTAPNSDDWYFAGGDFTVEAYVKPRGSGQYDGLIGFGQPTTDKSWTLFNRSSTGLQYWSYSSDGSDAIDLTTYDLNIPDDKFHHIAFSRVGNTLYQCWRGQVVAQHDVTGVSFRDTAAALIIGKDGIGGSFLLTGDMANLRITKGVGRYAEAIGNPISIVAFGPYTQSPIDTDPHWANVNLLLQEPTSPTTTDPHWANVGLLLDMQGD